MADFELLAPGGHQELVDEVLDRLDTKADYDGYYAQLTAGAADSLTGRGDGVSASYLYRTTGGDADVADGTATVKSIHGQTVRWNQLCKVNARTATSKGVTYTADASGKVTISAPSGATDSESFYTDTNNLYAPIAGHKYIAYGTNADGTVVLYHTTMGALRNTVITFTGTSVAGTFNINVDATFSGTYEFYPQLFDLTQMFGAGNEPATVAEFEALFPEPYYPYDAGSLLSVQMEGIETVGFNQWDGEWEVGSISVATGQNIVENNTIRSKNYSPCFPDTEYYIKSTTAAYVFWYRADKSYISNVYTANRAKTSPAGAAYFRVRVDNTNTYHGDICINLSWSGYRDGEYEPYWKSERTIPAATYFPNGMRSAGTVYDELTSDAAVTRVGAVDLGALAWEKYDVSGVVAFRSYGLPNLAPATSSSVAGNVTSAEYDTYGSGNLTSHDKGIAVSVDAHVLYLRNSAFDNMTAAEAKAALSGVLLHYALATPTATPIDPPLNLSYRVSDFGTERIMHTDPTAPPTLVVTYGSTADGIRDRALAAIAPVENGLASANYGVGSYLIHAGQLCRVTTAIAAGEAITIGTNVVATTVMAELLTLTQ